MLTSLLDLQSLFLWRLLLFLCLGEDCLSEEREEGERKLGLSEKRWESAEEGSYDSLL